MVVVWSPNAKAALKNAFSYIAKDSRQNAEKVFSDILYHAEKLAEYPEFYPPDKYKKDNNGSWRAFEIHRFRVSYRIRENQIRIIRLRHTSMSPLQY